jgi:hypothetical protein
MDSNGFRADLTDRPELMSGSIEFVAPQEYMVRPPMPPVFFFLIDGLSAYSLLLSLSFVPSVLLVSSSPLLLLSSLSVSMNAIKTGMVKTVCDSVLDMLDKLPGGKVRFVCFSVSLSLSASPILAGSCFFSFFLSFLLFFLPASAHPCWLHHLQLHDSHLPVQVWLAATHHVRHP